MTGLGLSGIDCAVYAGGVRLADGSDGFPDLAPAVLSALSIPWGRSTTIDQPEPSTCSFTVQYPEAEGRRIAEQLDVGAIIDVIASGIPPMVPGPPQASFAWDGDPHASTSTRTDLDETVQHNVATNPSFETGAATALLRTNLANDPAATVNSFPAGQNFVGWRARWFGSSPAAGTTTAIAGAVDGPPGTALTTYLRKTWTTPPPSGQGGDLGFEHTGATSPAATAPATDGLIVTPGQVIALSSWLRFSRATVGNFNLQVWWRDAAGNYLSTSTVVPVQSINGTWQRVAGTFTVPAGAYRACFITDFDGSAAGMVQAGDTLDGTGLLVEVGGRLGEYFDGGRPVGPDFQASWTGTVNASNSELRGTVPATVTPRAGWVTAVRDSSWAAAGTYSCRLDLAGANNSTDTFVSLPASMLQVGRSYTIIATYRLTQPVAGGNTPRIWARAGVEVNLVGPSNQPGVYQVRGTITPTAAAEFFRLYHGGNVMSGSNYSVWWDAVAVIDGGSSASDYFDGDTAPVPGPDVPGEPERVMVFQGRVTDAKASAGGPWVDDDGAIVPTGILELTATDFTADLDARMVGDEPWPQETLGERMWQILTLAGWDLTQITAPTLAEILVSWQDVDRQAAAGLLRDLAQTADGVLWAAATIATGQYLRLEDPAMRESGWGLVWEGNPPWQPPPPEPVDPIVRLTHSWAGTPRDSASIQTDAVTGQPVRWNLIRRTSGPTATQPAAAAGWDAQIAVAFDPASHSTLITPQAVL